MRRETPEEIAAGIDAPRGHERDERVVWYALRGSDLDPDEISRRTGLVPTRSWRRGDRSPFGPGQRRDGLWLVDSGLPRSAEFHECLAALLARLQPAWVTLIELGRSFEAEVTAAIFCYEAQGPLVTVEPTASAALAALNATLGFDLYALADDGGDAG